MLKTSTSLPGAGRFLGIAGVEGNGQRELIEIITGLRPIEDGTIKIGGKDSSHFTVRQIRDAKVGHIPQDRLTYGAYWGFHHRGKPDLRQERQPHCQQRPLLSAKRSRTTAPGSIRDFEIKCADENVLVRMPPAAICRRWLWPGTDWRPLSLWSSPTSPPGHRCGQPPKGHSRKAGGAGTAAWLCCWSPPTPMRSWSFRFYGS